jgi:hypothetical protein
MGMVVDPAIVNYLTRSLYIGKYLPPRGGGGISADVIKGKKYENAKNKKGKNVKEKGRKGEEKGRKRKKKEEKGRKRKK